MKLKRATLIIKNKFKHLVKIKDSFIISSSSSNNNNSSGGGGKRRRVKCTVGTLMVDIMFPPSCEVHRIASELGRSFSELTFELYTKEYNGVAAEPGSPSPLRRIRLRISARVPDGAEHLS